MVSRRRLNNLPCSDGLRIQSLTTPIHSVGIARGDYEQGKHDNNTEESSKKIKS